MSWISVKDRLPELNNDVLIVIANKTNKNDREVSVGHFSHFNELPALPLVWHICLSFEEKILPNFNYHVTHWQPLPEPPKEK